MSYKNYWPRTSLCTSKLHHVVILAVAAFTAVQPGQLAAQPPAVTLTQVGSPIWRPVDFQQFSAPVEPDAAVTATNFALEPLQPLGPGAPYTVERRIELAANDELETGGHICPGVIHVVASLLQLAPAKARSSAAMSNFFIRMKALVTRSVLR